MLHHAGCLEILNVRTDSSASDFLEHGVTEPGAHMASPGGKGLRGRQARHPPSTSTLSEFLCALGGAV